jgi:CRP-like cAMP-binding protein
MRPGPSKGNRLVSLLPLRDRRRLTAGCEVRTLDVAEELAHPGTPIRHVYFPTAGSISLLVPENGQPRLEVGLVGDEGMLGIALYLGVNVWPWYARTQGAGTVLRMAASPFRTELQRSPALRRVLSRYLYVVLIQLAQSSACTRFHLVEARLARWLLMTQDRAHSDAFRITHEHLALMLGVRRVGVTQAATALQQRALISYCRGAVSIIDRSGLEAAACSCYAADRAVYARVL